MPPEPQTLGILLISPGHERAHYAFMVAVAAAAIGRTVVIFATNDGCQALTTTLANDPREATVTATGVAGLAELQTAATELGIRLLACDSGLRMAGLQPQALMPGTEISGLPAFLSAVGGGAVVTL